MPSHTKKVEKLGQKFDVPVECHPSSIEYVARQLKELGAISTKLRIAEDGKDGPIITESGNFIIDTKFEKIEEMLEKNIKSGINQKETIEKYINLKNLNREIVEILIDYIYVGKRIKGTKEIPIEIHWNF